MPADTFCTECGEPLREGAKFCGSCGYTAGSPDGEAASTPAPAPVPGAPPPAIASSRNPLIYGACVLVVVLMIFFSAARNEGAGAAVILFDGLISPVALVAIGIMVVRGIFFSGGRPSASILWGALALVVGLLIIVFGAIYPFELECSRDQSTCTWNGIYVGEYNYLVDRYTDAYREAEDNMRKAFIVVGAVMALGGAVAMLMRRIDVALREDDEEETRNT